MDLIRKRLRESLLMEKMVLKNYDEYVKLVAEAYQSAKDYDSSVLSHWKALNASNYVLFQRLLSKVNLIFTTNNRSDVGSINIAGRDFKIEYIEPGEEYKTASEMRNSFESTGTLKISIDYSEHPVFSVADNIVFRTIHDYMAHILGGHDFGAKGEIASYNRHAKLAPKDAIPALFTEVIGQACTAIATGTFPKQKIVVLEGFDFYNLGKVDDENYEIIDKTLIKKSEKDNLEKQKELDKQKGRQEPVALKEPVKEPELEVAHTILDRQLLDIKEEEVDSWSSYKGVKPYKERVLDFKNSIKTFQDLDDDKIHKFIDFFGWEGFDNEDEAFNDLKERIDFYKKLPNPAIMYRAVGVKDKKMIDVKNIGEHVTPYKWAIDGDMLLMIGSENWDNDVTPYVMELSVPLSEIDIIQTIIQNLAFPNEHEINLKNKGKGVKFIKAYKLKGY